MSRLFKNLTAVSSLSLVLTMLTADIVFAQASGCSKNRNVGIQALDEFTWNQLNKVYQDVGEEQYDEAYDQLRIMLNQAGEDGYLPSVLNQALAQVEWSRDKHDSALKYFEKAVQLDALPDQAHFALMYQIAQLYFMQERFTEALDKLDLWLCKSPGNEIPASAYVLKAAIHARQEDYTEALQAIEIAIGMDDAPREQWFQLKLASHYELEQYPAAAQTLEFIITRWPEEKRYWTQLSQIYFKLERDEKALAMVALAYRKGLLNAQEDIIYLSNLYRNSEVPLSAARVLEQGIRDGIVDPTPRHWTAVADSWYAAEELENSLDAYKNAGNASADGRADLRRAFILVDLERWPDALKALHEALDKGGITERQSGEAYLLRGVAQFRLGNFDKAGDDWAHAGRYHAGEAAGQWINYLCEGKGVRKRGQSPFSKKTFLFCKAWHEKGL